MYRHEIAGMAEKIAQIEQVDAEKIRKALEEYWEDKIAVIWGVEDVQDLAENEGIELTKEEARDILRTALRRHDASIGINWTVLEVHITQR